MNPDLLQLGHFLKFIFGANRNEGQTLKKVQPGSGSKIDIT